MSEDKKINKDDLIKSLAEAANLSEEEAAKLINDNEGDDKVLEKAKKPEEDEDEYSEDKEKEMEKAMMDAKTAFEAYKGKKPKKEVEKSLEENLSPSNNDEMLKSMETLFGGLKESFEEKLDTIEKSVETSQDTLKEELELMKSQIEEIGSFTPSPKMEGMTNQAIIEKAIDGGIQEDGKIHLSLKAHKDQIGELVGELVGEAEGDMLKSLEVDLSNYVAGSGILGETAKRILAEKKNVVVH